MFYRVFSGETMRQFDAFADTITAEILQHTAPLPPVLDRLPHLPERPPRPTETFSYGGWWYCGLMPGIYHAWPDTDDFYQDILDAWLACMETPVRRMVPAFQTGLGPIFTGTIIVEGVPERTAAPATVFADAISLPFTFDDSSLRQQFCPVLALAAPRPVESFLKELLRSYYCNGQMTIAEYTRVTQDMYSEISPDQAHLNAGRTEFVGHLTTVPDPADGDGHTVWVAGASIAAADHPRFEVDPRMVGREERWPAVLKRTPNGR